MRWAVSQGLLSRFDPSLYARKCQGAASFQNADPVLGFFRKTSSQLTLVEPFPKSEKVLRGRAPENSLSAGL
jgi:hypothetical protein